jgi:hypothetical protein
VLFMRHLERRTQPLAPRRVYFARIWRNFLATLGIVAFSLTLGTLGYHYLGHVGWIDGFLNASMILTGMGPVDRIETSEGKLFAAFYALYSGLAFLTMVAVVLAPVYHRFLHHFHLCNDEEEERLAALIRRKLNKPGDPPPG